MGTVDLKLFDNNQIVIHYGGSLNSVDAYTFANSLVALADTITAVNTEINPGQSVEVRVEAIGTGSFRALLKRTARGAKGFFSRGAENLIWAVLGALIYEKLLQSDSDIIVNTDEVIIKRGQHRIIIPRTAYDHATHLKNKTEVARPLSRTFEVIESDPAIENFGLTPQIADETPLLQITRGEYARLSRPREALLSNPDRRIRSERARLLILKPWLSEGMRKWSFEWNGVPVSAPIADGDFLARLVRREFLIGAGDALDVLFEYEQYYDEQLEIFVNDNNTFVVAKVYRRISGDEQISFADDQSA